MCGRVRSARARPGPVSVDVQTRPACTDIQRSARDVRPARSTSTMAQVHRVPHIPLRAAAIAAALATLLGACQFGLVRHNATPSPIKPVDYGADIKFTPLDQQQNSKTGTLVVFL